MILSSDDQLGAELVANLREEQRLNVNYYGGRADAIESITNQEFAGFVFFDPKGTRDVELLIRYMEQIGAQQKTNIFIASSTMDLFKETIEKYLHLDIRLITLPRDCEEVSSLIMHSIFPEESKGTNVNNGYRVDTSFIRVFIDSTSSVMNDLLGDVNIHHMAPFFMTARLEDVAVCSHLIIESDYFSGTFYFSMPSDTYLNIYKNIVGEEYSNINEENIDFINEMTNMIYGKSKATFEKMSYKFDMAFPQLCPDNPLESKQDIVVIPYNSDVGRFYLKIGIN